MIRYEASHWACLYGTVSHVGRSAVKEILSAGDYEVDDYLIIISILGGKYPLTVRSGTRSVIAQVHRVHFALKGEVEKQFRDLDSKR